MNLRAGLVGYGAMGRNHARILNILPGVDFVGIYDPQILSHETIPFPIFPSLKALIDQSLDYCVVATPTTTHELMGVQLADSGVNALIEKPLAHTLESARVLTTAFERANLVGGVGFIERFNPAVLMARAKLTEGAIGELVQVTTRRQGPFPSRIADVGVTLDLLSHDMDLASWITQDLFHSVAAYTSYRSGRCHEDLISASGQLMRGTVTNHLANWLSPLKERQTVLTGTSGVLQIDTLSADLTLYENASTRNEWEVLKNFRGVTEGNIVRFAVHKDEPLLVEHRHYRDALLGKPSSVATMKEASYTMAVIEALLESTRYETKVQIAKQPGQVMIS